MMQDTRIVLAALMAAAWPLLAQSMTERGVMAFQQGRYLQASRLLQDALGSDPRDEHARTFLALAREINQWQAEQSIGDVGHLFAD